VRISSKAPFPGRVCPSCGESATGSKAIDDDTKPPEEGDLNICAYCFEVSLFTGAEGGLRSPTTDERRRLLADPEVIEAVRDVRENWSTG
jgi:hypothetical protein